MVLYSKVLILIIKVKEFNKVFQIPHQFGGYIFHEWDLKCQAKYCRFIRYGTNGYGPTM